MNDNPLFDSEPAAPFKARQSYSTPQPAGGFLIFTGWAVFAVCLIAGLVMYVKLENDRVGERDKYGNRSHNRDPDPYANHYFPGCLTLLMGSVQGLVIVGLGMVVRTQASQNQTRPANNPI